MSRIIDLKYVCLVWDETLDEQHRITNIFPDGRTLEAWPHPDQPHYHVIAHRLGYGDDLWAYALEHEFCHSFVCEEIGGRPSHVLRCLLNGTPADPLQAAQEEALTQAFQRWLRANERPILASVDWDGMKSRARSLLGS